MRSRRLLKIKAFWLALIWTRHLIGVGGLLNELKIKKIKKCLESKSFTKITKFFQKILPNINHENHSFPFVQISLSFEVRT